MTILTEKGHQCLGEGEGADEIHIKRFFDVVDFRMLAVNAHVPGDAGVVDQQRQFRVFRVDFLGSLFDGCEVSQFDVHPTSHVDAQ